MHGEGRRERLGVDDGEPLGRAGEGHVEGAQTLDLVGHDVGRLDDDDAVELESLDDADRHHGDRIVETGAGRPSVLDPGLVERRRDLVGQRVRDDDGDVARRQLGGHLRRRLGHGRPEVAIAGHPDDRGRRVADAHRPRRAQLRRRRRHDPIGQLHDLGGDAIADGQPDHPGRLAVGEVGEHVVPVVRGERPGGLGEVADDGERAVERPPRRHLELHRGEVLDLVDDDVPVRADLVRLVDLAVAAEARAEHLPGVVEQGHVRGRPAHVVHVGGTRPVERSDLLGATAGRRRPGRAGRVTRTGRGAARPGVSTGHIRSRAARTSGCERIAWRSSLAVTASPRQLAAIAANTSFSTKRRPALWRRNRRRAALTMRADSSTVRRTKPVRNGTRSSSRSGRSRSRTALSITADMRASPLTWAASGESPGSTPGRAHCTSGTRSASTTCSTPASPSDGSTRSM